MTKTKVSFWRKVFDALCSFAVWVSRVRVITEGTEKIPNTPFLLVSNHRSSYDPIILNALLKKFHVRFISKPENFKIPIAGFLMKKCGFLAIDRESPRNAMKTILAAAEIISDEKVPVVVYPEGTRNKDPENGLLPFHNGVVKIAKRADAPIVVAVAIGTEKVKENWPWKRTEVHLKIVDILDAEYTKHHNDREIGERVRASMEAVLGY